MQQVLDSSACPVGVDPAQLRPVPELFGGTHEMLGGRFPVVLRGAANHWPALHRWTFSHLAERGGARPVTLVHGNRELGTTRFAASTFRDFVQSLEPAPDGAGGAPRTGHLKEFDLLKELPELAGDAPAVSLFPPGHLVSSSAWIGPRSAHTGLHYDLIDNLAVLVRGAKRFYLARPGTVEAAQARSRKYDRWARLAAVGLRDLVDRPQAAGALFCADLGPGDAIYVPRGWWHEVVNLQASIFLSGFFGSTLRLRPLWMATGVRQFFHDVNPFGERCCTCHPGDAGRRHAALRSPQMETS